MALFIAKLALVLVFQGSSIFKNGRSLLLKYRRWLLPVSALIVFSLVFKTMREQFLLWYNDGVARALVPPYSDTGISYFLFGYSLPRFFAPYIISFIAAWFFIWFAGLMNRKYGGRFFYEEEIYFAGAAVFLTGYPGVVYFFVLLILVHLIFQILSVFLKGVGERMSLYYLWFGIALFVIIIVEVFSTKLPQFLLLKI